MRKLPKAPDAPRGTPKNEWVKEGDRCISIWNDTSGGVLGTVLSINNTFSIPYVVVKWDGGFEGKHTITILRKVKQDAVRESGREMIPKS